MIHKQLQNIIWLVGLVLLQVMILNNIHLLGYATPFLYIYLVVRYDTGISRNQLMMLAFGLGLIVDIFSNTPGMNAGATVLLAFLRPSYLQLFTPRDVSGEIVPSPKVLGNSLFIRYLFVAVFTHHLALYAMMFFSFSSILLMLIQAFASTLLTVACILGIEWIRSN